MSEVAAKAVETEFPFVERDISWLGFNYRVLQEAKDPSVPLLERLKFLAIYSSNLDEFFRVRVAHHRNLVRVGKKTKKRLHQHPKHVLREIQSIVNQQQEEFTAIFREQIIPGLAQYGIHVLDTHELQDEQISFIEQFFEDNLLPFVQPVLLVKDKIRPFLNNATIYLCAHLQVKDNPESPAEFAIVQVPSERFPRFIDLPSTEPERHDLILLDDIIRHKITWLFPGYDILNSYSIKLTRDAELYIDDEYAGDLLSKIRSSLAKRNVGPASRLVYDKDMPLEMLDFLMDVLEVGPLDVLPEGRYHNNFDFFKFPDFGKTALKEKPLPALPYIPLEEATDFFGAIDQGDHIICVPYHSYEATVRFFEQAATDPAVTHIKIVQYRVAKESRIMNALMRAVRAGKRVSAFIEVKARFDEEANLSWGERLEEAGVTVRYSLPGLKVHSKLALVRRVESGGPKLYTYLSTGNFHEGTVKVYSDFGLFTADPRITAEVARVFSFLEAIKLPANPFGHLLVGQFNLRSTLERYIKYEIKHAKAGKATRILLKLNSLQDEKMINLLYAASRAGVKIQLIVRGICSLVPGRKGLSENIEAISIVDRYLEHARVFYFYHGGKELIYLSSADWMTRNLSHRIESCFPIYDPEIRKQVMDVMRIQLNDNVKARNIGHKKTNTYRTNDQDLVFRSQVETYYYFKRRNEEIIAAREAEIDDGVE